MGSECYAYFDPDPPGGALAFAGTDWKAQLFYVVISHELTSVKLRLSKLTGNPNTITVSIRATDGLVPIGSDLASGTTNGNTLPSSPNTELREINISSDDLVIGSRFAIVVRAPAGDANSLLWWGSPSADIRYATSNNSGVSWTQSPTATRLHFEEWGIASEGEGVDTTVVGTKVSLEAIRNIEMVYGGRFFIDKSGNAVYESRYHRNV